MKKTFKHKNFSIFMDTKTEYEIHRFETILTKEPETISWIEEFFKPGDVFFDIGANIGVYSLYATAFHKKEVKVFAFEPAYHNFNALCKNIQINNFADTCLAYPLAIGEKTERSFIELASLVSGSAMHIMPGSSEQKEDNFKPEFKQGIISITLDDLVNRFGFSSPTHLKIDTDGFEEQIISGGDSVFKKASLKSVLIEVDNEKTSAKRIRDFFRKIGFREDHPINFQDNHSKERRKSSKRSFENIIFTR